MSALFHQDGRDDGLLRSAPSQDWAHSVLPRGAFDLLLDRERSLADRGTRLFTLIVLRQTRGRRGALESLAQELRIRLRSTDVVGRLGEDRLGVLLSDTDPVGAGFLTGIVDAAKVEHGLDLVATMYVYPSVEEAVGQSRRGPDEHNGSPGAHGTNGANGKNGGPGAGGQAAGESSNGASTNGKAHPPESNGTARAESRWPMQDLWIELAVPLPLWKRSFDVLIASILLITLLPLFVLIAIAICLDSPGPAIFRQTRLGRGGRSFAFFKFRSMSVDAEAQRAGLAVQNEQDGPVFKMADDPRMTRVGRMLRRWSLDELPQLWNVLRGDISLVGPRSPTPDEVPAYERWQRRRLTVTGGLTCTWQVGGRSEIPFKEWMRMDIRYIERRGMLYDLWLLAKTVPAVLTGRGAH